MADLCRGCQRYNHLVHPELHHNIPEAALASEVWQIFKELYEPTETGRYDLLHESFTVQLGPDEDIDAYIQRFNGYARKVQTPQNEFGNQQRTKSSTPDSSQLLLGPSNNHNINHNITNNIEETNNRRTIILRS